MSRDTSSNERTHSRLLEEVETFLVNASSKDIEKALEGLAEKGRIDAAVERMQRGIGRLLKADPASPHQTLAAAAFAGAHNSPAQSARVRMALGIALDPKLSDEINQTPKSIFELEDAEALSLYESLKVNGRVP